jgi:hypothetical protein
MTRFAPVLALIAAATAGGGGGACSRARASPVLSSATLTSAQLGGPGDRIAGTQDQRFVVRIGRTLSTATTSAGQAFEAEAVTPLRTSDGIVLVDAGAPLLGHVAEVAFGGAAPRMSLAFDAVETRRGPAALAAVIEGARHYVVPAVSLPPRVGPFSYEFERTNAQLVVPAGAEISLRLTAPLITVAPPPNTR